MNLHSKFGLTLQKLIENKCSIFSYQKYIYYQHNQIYLINQIDIDNLISCVDTGAEDNNSLVSPSHSA